MTMNQNVAKFLEFKGKTLLFTSVGGDVFVAVKPVCEAIGVEYTRTFKNIVNDPILAPALAKQPIQVPGDQVRNMACLPEKFVYGWLFSIKSASSELLEYKRECYNLLYDHFHGSIINRSNLVKEKLRIRKERSELEDILKQDSRFVALEALRAEEARIGKAFKQLDEEDLSEQGRLF